LKHEAYFEFSDTEAHTDWRAKIAWPIDIQELRRHGQCATNAALDWCISRPEQEQEPLAKSCIILALTHYMALFEATWVAQEAIKKSIRLNGGPTEIKFLTTGDKSTWKLQPLVRQLAEATPRFDWLRRSARAVSWSNPRDIFRTFSNPDLVAVSHNSLASSEFRRKRRAVGFRRASTYWCMGTLEFDSSFESSILEELIALFASLETPLSTVFQERLLIALRNRIEPIIAQTEHVAGWLRTQDLPEHIATGTLGSISARVLAAEVARRGGFVETYDHGGQIAQIPELQTIIDLVLPSQFWTPTSEWTNLLQPTVNKIAWGHTIELRGGEGEPLFINACRDMPASNPVQKMIYIGHPFRGLRTPPISTVCDAIYWDFQLRLIEILKELPATLLCKPHPEGAFRGTTNPLSDFAKVSYQPFEEHLDDADVFVIDAPTSTTFLEIMCTQKRVVLIDRGHYPANPYVTSEIERRCEIVPVRYDDRGRLFVDAEQLSDAIFSSKAIDPTFFRRLAANVI